MFCAHLDTVPHTGPIEVVDDEGLSQPRRDDPRRRQQGGRRGLHGAGRAERRTTRRVGLELLFTVAEEQGLRGAKAFDASTLRSRVGFVLDHAGPVGEVIVSTPTQQQSSPTSSASRRTQGSSPRTAARDRGRRGGDRPDGARPPRRGDDRQRRPDPGWHLGQCRPRPLLIHAEARSLDPERVAEVAGRMPTPAPGGRASTAATSTSISRSSSAATGSGVLASLALAEAGLEVRGTSPCGPRSAAVATPTPSDGRASTASSWRTAHTPSTPPTNRSLSASSRRCSRSAKILPLIGSARAA